MLVFGVLAVAAFGDTALNAWPMLFAHDAATGYLAGETLVTWWARTQQPSERAFTCARPGPEKPESAAGARAVGTARSGSTTWGAAPPWGQPSTRVHQWIRV